MNTYNAIVLTGDRPTGKLHLGHYAGSLRKRVEMQDEGAKCFIMIADAQAYTDNARDTQKVREAIPEVMFDYIAAGIDPDRSVIFLQSAVPELAELSMIYLNLVTVSRLERNPTIRNEITLRNFNRDVPAGFLCYPAAQAADITAFKATHVPVGDDQLPMIELAQEMASRINHLSGKELLPSARAVLSKTARLPGIDGKAKASKSLGNAIFLDDTADEVRKKVMSMYTDPDHLRVEDPGKIEGNVVFAYLDAFDPRTDEIEDLKARYRAGGLGDVSVKKRLVEVMEAEMSPIREARRHAAACASTREILTKGTEAARAVCAATLREIREGLGMFAL